MAPLAVAQSVLEQYEQALDEVGKVAGLASRPSISEAKKALRSLGCPALASRLGRLSKKRNGVAHPDPGLLAAISAVRGGGEVAAKNAVQLLDDAGEAPVSEPAGEPPVPLGGGLAHEGGHDQPPFPAAEQDAVYTRDPWTPAAPEDAFDVEAFTTVLRRLAAKTDHAPNAEAESTPCHALWPESGASSSWQTSWETSSRGKQRRKRYGRR